MNNPREKSNKEAFAGQTQTGQVERATPPGKIASHRNKKNSESLHSFIIQTLIKRGGATRKKRYAKSKKTVS